MNSDLLGAVVRCSKEVNYIVTVKSKLAKNIHSSFQQRGIDVQTRCLTYSSHGVDAVDVVVGPAGGQLVGVLLLLCMDTKTD